MRAANPESYRIPPGPPLRPAPHPRAERRLLTLTLLCLIALIVSAGVYVFPFARAAWVLSVFPGGSRPVQLFENIVGDRPTLTETLVPGAAGPIEVRIYSPQPHEGRKPMVLIHGFAPDGNHNGYLDEVGLRMARLGYFVVIPTLPAASRNEMRTSDLTVVGDIIHWSARQTGQKVSVFGISFGGGLAVAATGQPGVAPDVKLIFSLSGFNDLTRIAHYYIHDPVFDPEGRPYAGITEGPLLIATPYLSELVPPADVPLLRPLIHKVVFNHGQMLAPDDPDLMKLDDRRLQEFEDLEYVHTDHMRSLYHGVLDRHGAEMLALSPVSVLQNLKVPLYVLSGESDPVFPNGEIEWMQRETASNPNVHFLVTPWITHAFFNRPISRTQKMQVLRFGANMLTEASRNAPAP